MVVSGRGTQKVGDDALDLGPGDICFIPREHARTGSPAPRRTRIS